MDLRNMPENQPSLCIPRVFKNIDEDRIRGVFDALALGTIERIDIIVRKNEKGDDYKRVFVHFYKWFWNENAQTARRKLISGKEIKIVYDGPWFWKVSANNCSVPQLPREIETRYTRPHIEFDDEPRYNEHQRPRYNEHQRPRYNEQQRPRQNEQQRPRHNQEYRPHDDHYHSQQRCNERRDERYVHQKPIENPRLPIAPALPTTKATVSKVENPQILKRTLKLKKTPVAKVVLEEGEVMTASDIKEVDELYGDLNV